jgi:phosphoribosyl-AMP cyclohydrolase
MSQTEFYKLFYSNETLYSVAEETIIRESQALPTLVEESVIGEVVKQEEEESAYPYKIVVLVDNPHQEELDASEGVLLYKILKAVGYDSEDTDIVNVGYLSQEALQEVMRKKTAHYVISFGVPFRKVLLDLLVPPYEPMNVQGVSFLLADPLSVVEADVSIKKRLWGVLRAMFPNI